MSAGGGDEAGVECDPDIALVTGETVMSRAMRSIAQEQDQWERWYCI